MESKLKFLFSCDECKKEYKTWPGMARHLEKNQDHAPLGYGLVNVWRMEDDEDVRVTEARVAHKILERLNG